MNNWENKHILITRPAHQAQNLMRAISAQGASVLLFPTLIIHAVNNTQQLKKELAQAVSCDWYMFVSPNAVNYALPALEQENILQHMHGQFACVGAGTADELFAFGVKNITYPLDGVGAQALLDTLAFEDFNNKTVAIFKGNSDNAILEEGLTQQGALIQDVTCYQRTRTEDDATPVAHAIEHNHIHLIVTTSGDTLKHLVHIVPGTLPQQLFTLPVLFV